MVSLENALYYMYTLNTNYINKIFDKYKRIGIREYRLIILAVLSLTLTVACIIKGAVDKRPLLKCSVSRSVVRVGEDFDLKVIAKIPPKYLSYLELPRLDDFKLIEMKRSQNFSKAKKTGLVTLTLLYKLVPEIEGDFTIGSVSIELDDKGYVTEPIKLKVLGNKENGI